MKATNGDQLPLKLVSFWKCEPSMTNFRLDYIYQPSSLKQPKKPTMTNISVVVPVSGGVRKSLSKPEGNWVAEQNRMMWKLEDLKPEEGTSLSLSLSLCVPPFKHTYYMYNANNMLLVVRVYTLLLLYIII